VPLTVVSAGSSPRRARGRLFETRLRRPQDEVAGRANSRNWSTRWMPAFAGMTTQKVFHVKHLRRILIRELFRANRDICSREQGDFCAIIGSKFWLCATAARTFQIGSGKLFSIRSGNSPWRWSACRKQRSFANDAANGSNRSFAARKIRTQQRRGMNAWVASGGRLSAIARPDLPRSPHGSLILFCPTSWSPSSMDLIAQKAARGPQDRHDSDHPSLRPRGAERAGSRACGPAVTAI
jgi:hypothetical protein